MEISKEKYDTFIKEVRTLGMYKKRVQDQDKEILRLNRVISLREKEIQELNLLLSKKIDFYNNVRGRI